MTATFGVSSVLFSHRLVAVASARVQRSAEKLATGLRVNRAADDAAALQITERLRAQARGTQQAARNAQEGVSVIQTAESALSETANILGRMRELTVRAGSTSMSVGDRQAIGSELVSLRAEIDKIADRTRYNGIKLLQATAAPATTTFSTIPDIVAAGDSATVTIDVSGAAAATTFSVTSAGNDVTITNNATSANQTVNAQTINGGNPVRVLDFNSLGIQLTLTRALTGGNGTLTAAELAAGLNGNTIVTEPAAVIEPMTFHTSGDLSNALTLTLRSMESSALGNGGANDLSDLVTDADAVSTLAKATNLAAALDTAIGQVAAYRAQLGAIYNQLETAIRSLHVSADSVTASESRARDADIARVSSEVITRRIVERGAGSVLEQASALPRNLLPLLARTR